MFIESPFLGYPTCLFFAHVVWWSTAVWTATTTRWRRPERSLTMGCITSVEIFQDVKCCGDGGWHESCLYFQPVWPHLEHESWRWRHRGRQAQLGGEDQGDCWHWDVSYQLSLSSTKTWSVVVVDMKVVYTFNMSDQYKYMWVDGWRHHGWQGQ